MKTKLAALSAWPLLPVLLAQGIYLRRRVPRLPDAAGPVVGQTDGAGPVLHLLMLGESTVAGVGAPDHETALTGQVAGTLHQLTGRPIHWRALGLSGATARRAARELLPQLSGRRADVAVIALGVNDVLKLHSPARWQRDLTALLAGIREQAGPGPVVLAGVPPLAHFPALPPLLRQVLGARAARLDAASRMWAVAQTEVRHAHFPFAPTERNFCADGFHPGPSGYAAWGAFLGEIAAEMLLTGPAS